jgi:hypothetical protein
MELIGKDTSIYTISTGSGAGGIAALNEKTGNDTMEDGVVKVTLEA